MQTPEWLRPALYGGVGGAAVAVALGFVWGGWMTASSAEKMALAQSQTAVLTALIPVCLDLSERDPGRIEKLAAIKAATTYKRGDAVMEAGWATMPGAESPDRNLARACVEKLALDAP